MVGRIKTFLLQVFYFFIGFAVVFVALHVIITLNPQLSLYRSVTPFWYWVLEALVIEVVLAYIGYKVRERFGGPKPGTEEYFEKQVTRMFRDRGYGVERAGEHGIDLILKKDGQKTAVRLQFHKQYMLVDNTSVQIVAAGRTKYSCDHALLVTNGRYTPRAHLVAKKLGVTLWDKNDIAK